MQILKLRNCARVTDSAIEQLSWMQNLMVLDIVNTGAKQLFSAFLNDGQFCKLAILYLGPQVHSNWLVHTITPETLGGRVRLNVYVNDICVVPWL